MCLIGLSYVNYKRLSIPPLTTYFERTIGAERGLEPPTGCPLGPCLPPLATLHIVLKFLSPSRIKALSLWLVVSVAESMHFVNTFFYNFIISSTYFTASSAPKHTRASVDSHSLSLFIHSNCSGVVLVCDAL